jgi:hypothetical protein
MTKPEEHLDPGAAAAHRALLLSWKRESEFNHHLAGVFVILAGLFILAEGSLRDRWPFLRYAWPGCFLLSGLFLLIFSDTELWPFGPQSWWHGLTHNREDLQHKAFAVLLLGVAFIEIQRRGTCSKPPGPCGHFPLSPHSAPSCFSSTNITAECTALTTWPSCNTFNCRIRPFITGFSFCLSKALSEVRTSWRSIFAKVWPLLLIVLGALLVLYKE